MFNFFKSKNSETEKCVVDQECEHATRPRGGHCNFQGMFLKQNQPQLLATDIHELKDLLLSNPHGENLTKISTVFPESWSPIECTQKIMSALASDHKKIIYMNRFGCLKIVAHTEENIEIVAFVNINKGTIVLSYPNLQEEIA